MKFARFASLTVLLTLGLVALPSTASAATPGKYSGWPAGTYGLAEVTVGTDGKSITNLLMFAKGDAVACGAKPSFQYSYTSGIGFAPLPIAADGSFSVRWSGSYKYKHKGYRYAVRWRGRFFGNLAQAIDVGGKASYIVSRTMKFKITSKRKVQKKGSKRKSKNIARKKWCTPRKFKTVQFAVAPVAG